MGDNEPFASKLNVNVDSMQDLTKNLREDGKAFSDEMTAWNRTDRKEHPMHAQIGHFLEFKEGQIVAENNRVSSVEVHQVTMQITNAITFLQMGADNIAQLFGGEDALANIKLKQIESMFPPLKPGTSAAGSGDTPPLANWKKIGTDGWDTDGDGKVDTVMPGSLDKSQNPTDDQRNQEIPDVDGSTHDGYDTVFDTINPHNGDNSWDDRTLSGAGQQNLYEHEPHETILAPGEFNNSVDGSGTSSGGSSNGTVVA